MFGIGPSQSFVAPNQFQGMGQMNSSPFQAQQQNYNQSMMPSFDPAEFIKRILAQQSLGGMQSGMSQSMGSGGLQQMPQVNSPIGGRQVYF